MFCNVLQNLLLCSTEESNLERHEGEEIMTEFISSNLFYLLYLAVKLAVTSSKSMLYCQVLFYVKKFFFYVCCICCEFSNIYRFCPVLFIIQPQTIFICSLLLGLHLQLILHSF